VQGTSESPLDELINSPSVLSNLDRSFKATSGPTCLDKTVDTNP
jgi:hypothetical protein